MRGNLATRKYLRLQYIKHIFLVVTGLEEAHGAQVGVPPVRHVPPHGSAGRGPAEVGRARRLVQHRARATQRGHETRQGQ